ncbi:MAG: hypothetical protein D6690_04050 [Nitrospirae bacterium]|nr:MAG: hypothetical protein D6690_04050 [Nitrospirota bacterium]
MDTQYRLLITLQTIDQRIFKLREQQRQAPERMTAIEAPVLKARKQLQAAQETGQALAKQKRSSEQELGSQEEHIRKLRGRMSELKTNKEYQAHLFEIDLAKKKKDELEEAVLMVMENVERNEQVIKQYESALQEAERVCEQEKARLALQTATAEQELAALEKEREEITRQLDPELLARYDKIKTMRKGVAVTPVRDGACTGCRIQLPPQLVAEVKRGDALLSCSYCHRILYWEGVSEDAQNTVAVAPGSDVLSDAGST